MKRRLRRKVEIDGPFGKTSAYATMTDLPDELVEKIVEDLDDNGSICRLSLTCKKLHFLVLPMFFSRNKLVNPQNGLFHCRHPVPELLEAIRTALFVRNLSSFTFYLTSEIEQVILDISSLRGLLARIPPVGQITIGLPKRIRYIDGSQGVRTMAKWGREFLKLLETIAESGCRDLRLLDPIGYLSNKFTPNNLNVTIPPPAKPTGSMSRRTRNSGGFRAHSHLTGMSTIQVLSSRLFQPFFIGWIIDTLEVNRESLVCIHLKVTSIDPLLLSRISESINLPAIKEVKISSRFNIVWVGLCSFLNRHPSTTSLHLEGILPVKDPQIPDPPIILPYLSQLTAISPIVTLLLQHRNRVPLLSSVHVLLNWNDQSELDPLAAVATHAHISSLQLSNGIGGDICAILNRYIREDKHTRVITSLAHIRSVILDQRITIHPGKFSPLTIKRWLYLFPHLEHVTLSLRLLDPRLGLSAEEKRDVVTEFATQFAADRPTMKTLSVGFISAINLDDLRRMPGFKLNEARVGLKVMPVGRWPGPENEIAYFSPAIHLL
ncbi:uncharacterized protein LACBIDRAFT_295081 [Laccaria bicolor S238N-H82]|uniref:Predicted protein n=1 Tax=Laccaria bicolor (strain S238N-H82 / ATCC MYA-4686) TaxID=486041 RepID=B0DMH4_LACBS|nr:uncharacterized protein LACBIDRAFT_295081 [Laccaria bicolor S238N-H82]EDR04290.1 predicted protein [Laccaria bicolor S238N-H82]|eukprot:XP_001885181.1 predicted protein [Laccaria bicolor S238N-H82]